jgi:hypothetical protein
MSSLAAASLVTEWRIRAVELRRYGAEAQAVTLERAAQELEDAATRVSDDLLTLAQAATEGGYSPDHLGRMIRDGKVPNAGRPNAPKIRRRDLPVKPATLRPPAEHATLANVGREQIARAVVTPFIRGRDG